MVSLINKKGSPKKNKKNTNNKKKLEKKKIERKKWERKENFLFSELSSNIKSIGALTATQKI